MYHRIVSAETARREGLQAGMFVTPETFEMHVEILERHFKIVHLSELLKIGGRTEISDDRPLCAITFDDGWYDFYIHAFPVLKKKSVPATVFLATDFMGTMNRFWTDRLAGFFMQYKGSIDRIPPSANTLINLIERYEGNLESRLEFAIEKMKGLRIELIENILAELSERWKIDSRLNEQAFLSWDEIREMKEMGLVAFGSHTASHPILTTLKNNEVRKELIASRENLISEGVVDSCFIPFCYPNGNYNKEIANIVKETGYSMAVTTKSGWNAYGCDSFTLQRIGIHQDMTSTEAMFACKIAQMI